MQLAVSSFIPIKEGGVEGEVIYADTEGSFEASRVKEIATHLVRRLSTIKGEAVEGEGEKGENVLSEKIIKGDKEEKMEGGITVEKIMEGIKYLRISDYVQQLAFVKILPNLLKEFPKVRTVIIDSVAFHFRSDFKDMAQRTRLLNSMFQSLASISDQFGVAVILINQVTTKFKTNANHSKTSVLVPALGESWAHNCTNRVILFFEEEMRKALLHKSPSFPTKTVPFVVNEEGIRDIP